MDTSQLSNDTQGATQNGETSAGANSSSTAPKPKAPPRPKVAASRTPGTSLLPVSRVLKIIKADKEIAGTAKEAVFLIAVATEEFMKRLALDGHHQAAREGRSVVMERDLAAAVKRADELRFLREIVPLPVPASTALAERKKSKTTAIPGVLGDEGTEGPQHSLEGLFGRQTNAKGKGKERVHGSELPPIPATTAAGSSFSHHPNSQPGSFTIPPPPPTTFFTSTFHSGYQAPPPSTNGIPAFLPVSMPPPPLQPQPPSPPMAIDPALMNAGGVSSFPPAVQLASPIPPASEIQTPTANGTHQPSLNQNETGVEYMDTS